MSIDNIAGLTDEQLFNTGLDRLTEYRLRRDPQCAVDVEAVLAQFVDRLGVGPFTPASGTIGVGGTTINRGAVGSYLTVGEGPIAID